MFMSQAINKLFWGILIILFNFYFLGINLLPNVVGYIVMAVGLGKLSIYSPLFSKARIFTVILAILSIPNLFQIDPWLKETSPILAIGYSVIVGILHLIVVILILQGMIQVALSENNFAFSTSVKKFFYTYISVSLLALFCMPMVLNVPDDVGVMIVIGTAVISIAMEIAFLSYLHKFRRLF